MDDVLNALNQRLLAFEGEAHSILSGYETAKRSRVVVLDATRRKMQGLSLSQERLLDEALACVEHGLFRAAHVAAWQAFMDFLEQKMASDGLVKLRAARTKWPQNSTIEELREQFPEHQIIEAARDVGLVSKSGAKSLLGMLSKRNECAHPSNYRPDMNVCLGYVSDVIVRIDEISQKPF